VRVGLRAARAAGRKRDRATAIARSFMGEATASGGGKRRLITGLKRARGVGTGIPLTGGTDVSGGGKAKVL
jgi:hypothetical protein